MMPARYIVEVVRTKTDEVVKRLGPFTSQRTADKVLNGVGINLNEEEYHAGWRVLDEGEEA